MSIKALQWTRQQRRVPEQFVKYESILGGGSDQASPRRGLI